MFLLAESEVGKQQRSGISRAPNIWRNIQTLPRQREYYIDEVIMVTEQDVIPTELKKEWHNRME